MKYVDGVLEFDRVHRSIGISAMVLDYFEDPWSFPSPRFRAWVLATKLRNAESGSNFIDHRLRESQQVILAGSGPEQWLLAGDALRSRHVIIPVLGYRVKRAPSFVRIPHCHGRFPSPLLNNARRCLKHALNLQYIPLGVVYLVQEDEMAEFFTLNEAAAIAEIEPDTVRTALEKRTVAPSRKIKTGKAVRYRFSEGDVRSEEHTSELQSQSNLVCRLLLEKKKD